MLLRARSVHAAKTLILERVFAEVWNCKINGHFLQENFLLGLIYISTRSFFTSLFLSISFLIIIPKNYKTFAHTIFLIIGTIITLLLAVYLLFQKENITNGYVSNERIIEITATWFLRVLGLFLGYALTKTNLENH